MSIRLRLALLYAVMTSFVILSVVLVAYTVHNRNTYLDVDRALVNAAEHFRPDLEADHPPENASATPSLGDYNVFVRFYEADGSLIDGSGPEALSPPAGMQDVLVKDDGPAYDVVLRWLPGGNVVDNGAFATEREPSTGSRVRLYVLPVLRSSDSGGYIQTWASLASADNSMHDFRLLMLGLGIGGLTIVSLGSFLLAGRALSPVAAMTQTARAITASRGFSRRLPEQGSGDELWQLARAFNEMLASLEEAYRAQQRFVAGASHELRAPLTAIQGNIELLARIQDMPPGERDEAVAFLQREVERLSRMVEELLVLARADAGPGVTRGAVELDELVLETLAGLVSERHRVAVNAIEPLTVEGDRDRLQQLVLILLDNALKYTPEDGRVAVGLGRVGRDALLRIRDTGIGISPEDLPRVFERFYRADPARGRDPGGAGLGLAIAKWIVDQHDGDVSLESALGQGTTVTVRLPLLYPSDSAETSDIAPLSEAAPRPLHQE